MLSLTVSVEGALWGWTVRGHLYECLDDGRRTLVGQQIRYYYVADNTAGVDDMTAACVVLRQWAERLIPDGTFDPSLISARPVASGAEGGVRR